MQVVKQKHEWDCGVAALAMFLNVPYGDMAKVVRDNIDDPRLKQRGLILRQAEQLIKLFGFKTKRVYRKEGYLDGANGLLGVVGGKYIDPNGHWVVVKDGLLIDPSGGEAWNVEDYLKEFGCRTATLLTII